MTSDKPKIQIAIMGAGPVGVAAARLIQHKDHANHYDVKVYELEAGEHARWQGSSIDLRPNSGLKAIAEAGLMDVFTTKARPDGEEMRFCDKQGNIAFEHAPFKEGSKDPVLGNPEISRGDLRDVLLGSLRPGTLEWGHKLTHVTPSASSPHRHIAHFTNGNTVEADLIIGADGAWSRTRNFLTDLKPVYTESMEVVGKGLCFFLSGDGKTHAHLQVNSDDEMTLNVSVHAPEAFFQKGGTFGPDVAADLARSRTVLHQILDGFTPRLTNTIDHLSGDFWSGGLYSMPEDVTWATRTGVTLIGDAVHCTTPHAGEGANTGMIDALELAELLVTFAPPQPSASSVSIDDVRASFAAFLQAHQAEHERILIRRAQTLIKLSVGNSRRLFMNPDFEDAIGYVRSRVHSTLSSKEMAAMQARRSQGNQSRM